MVKLIIFKNEKSVILDHEANENADHSMDWIGLSANYSD